MTEIQIDLFKQGDQQGNYNALDAVNTLAIAEHLFPILDGDPEYTQMYEDTIDLYGPLQYMMSRGIRVDHEALKETNIEITRQIEQLQLDINRVCKKEINPNSSTQMIQYFYVDLGIPPYTKLNTKKESIMTCDDNALQRLARGTSVRKGRPEASLIQRWRTLSKLKGTYLDMTFDADGRMRCSWNPRGTRFSRLSSSQTIFDTGMNMQNLPEEFKGFLVADPGMILVELDKRQAEWIVVAYLSQEANMIRVLEEGRDPHVHTACETIRSLGGSILSETVAQEAKVIGHSTNPDEVHHCRNGISELRQYTGWLPRNMSLRQLGKKQNHGLNYQETFKRFALDNELLEKDAKIVISAYHNIYPGIGRWHDNVKTQLQSDRTIRDLYGRKYRFLNRLNDDTWKAAISFSPQSTVGHLINRGISSLYADRSDFMEEIDLLAQVHDSILFQHPADRLRDLARCCRQIRNYIEPTLEAHTIEFGIPTDMKIGYNWKDMAEIDCNTTEDQLERNLIQVVRTLGRQKG